MEITVPRERNAEFEPTLIPKRHRRLSEFDDKVIALYARGMTTREIRGASSRVLRSRGLAAADPREVTKKAV